MSNEPDPSRPSEEPHHEPKTAEDGLTVGRRLETLDLLFDGSFDYPTVEAFIGADSFTYESPEGK